MPRKKNLSLAEEIHGEEIDVTEAEANDANTIVPTTAPPPAPVAPITLTFEQLQALLASSGAQQNTQSLADAFTKGMEQVREPKPENKFHPGISELNPAGERDFPRPGLKCEFFLGTQDAKTGHIYRTYPYDAQDLTAYEQIALNTLEPASAVIKRIDGMPIRVQVVPTRDPVSDEITRMVIVVPTDVIAKGSQTKNFLPSLVSLVAQITGKDFSTLSLDDLKWFMAEHREKRYVSARPAVAA